LHELPPVKPAVGPSQNQQSWKDPDLLLEPDQAGSLRAENELRELGRQKLSTFPVDVLEQWWYQ
jgi:hypothetical protein